VHKYKESIFVVLALLLPIIAIEALLERSKLDDSS